MAISPTSATEPLFDIDRSIPKPSAEVDRAKILKYLAELRRSVP
jgi:hypothetical protein